ncbi:MAG: TIGR02206 family membrane protein [Cyclobacteriaceae bacterium]
MNIWNDITHYTPNFKPYSLEHLIAVLLLCLAGYVLMRYAKSKPLRNQETIFQILCLVINASVWFWLFNEVAYDRFEWEKDIPFVFCNLLAALLPVFAFYRKKWLFNVIYYLVIIGAIMAIITPSLKFKFPHYESIKFWAVHGGLLIVIFYSIIIFKYRPTFKGVVHTLLFVQVYVVIITVFNLTFGTNYLYLNTKPSNGTILDLLGPWPWYVIFMDLLLIPFFLLSYLPFFLLKKKH